MNEILLQAIVEKLEAIELLLKVTDQGKEKGTDIAPIKMELDAFRKEIKALTPPLMQSSREEETGQKLIITRIEHKHHLHKGTWIAISLFITCFLLAYGWMSCHQSSQILEANDIKYRYLKIRGNKNVLNLCKYTDSLYQKDTDGFSARVEQEEQHLIDQVNVLRLAGEKEKTSKTIKVRTNQK